MMDFSIVVALDLCFSVLDHPPFSSGAAAAVEGDEPPISNSLMAAIKRSQANQRRHLDTFLLYQQQQSAGIAFPTFVGVKVELQHCAMSSDLPLQLLCRLGVLISLPRTSHCRWWRSELSTDCRSARAENWYCVKSDACRRRGR
ncbi:hypothetical protein KSP39_PZI003602 [Platanthera zijinensis]|uniref:Uncharacterized protein n=1 Tax=Platanthera zijinensis TaxID=2320716 RepID=A0AAP0BVI7_9ASPA